MFYYMPWIASKFSSDDNFWLLKISPKLFHLKTFEAFKWDFLNLVHIVWRFPCYSKSDRGKISQNLKSPADLNNAYFY